ncbi:spore germination protein [Paenibacillus sp. N4]|uniref:GerAB/ArcD/ProY family transporter n=1 Tax=Paenibacillus vietnamensis TaxID=2590547 RepID=UPI001CD14EF5|nr:endospore germination permease [Paenibacillus vietnamensis]MCA0758070.1 spore germination protein [Paenibacillus vietnamensis]
MKNQETITAGQLARLFFTFMTGSSIINIPAPLISFAKNDAWMSLLVSAVPGLLLLSCLLYMNKQYPGLTFIEYSNKAVGKWVTFILAIPFCTALFHMTASIVLDVDLFMTSSMMDETPMYVFSIIVMSAAAITVRAGIEAMARMFTIMIVVTISLIFVIFILAIPDYRPEQLLPLMPQGIKPMLHGAYFTYGFPFGEVIVFTMLLKFVRKQDGKVLNKYMYTSLIMNAVVLIISVVCTIMMFGPMAGERKYSLYQFARIIQVVDIIERIESIIAMALIAGSYMKATITLFALNLTITQLLKLKDDRILVLPISVICVLLSLILSEGMARFEETVSSVHPLFITVSYVIPLLIVMIVSMFRSHKASGQGAGSGSSAESGSNAGSGSSPGSSSG